MIAVASGVVLAVGLLGLCRLGEAALLSEAPYDVAIGDSPQLCGAIYRMDERQHLLVLSIPGTSVRHGFVVNLAAKQMGIASFPSYTRLGRFALVNRMTLDGYCESCGGLTADFAAGSNSTTIRVRGLACDTNPPDESTESLLRELLIYEKTIILTPQPKKGCEEPASQPAVRRLNP